MSETAVLLIKVVTDTTKAQAGLDQAAGKVGKVQGALSKVALPAAAAVGAIALVGKQAVDAASRTEQAMGAVDSVFDKNAGRVKQWANDAADSVGLAASEYSEFAALIGSQLKGTGLPMGQVTSQTKDLIAMGSDLAAMYGGTTAEAVEALSSALKGEMDPIEKYGVTLNQAAIKAEMAKKGQEGLEGAAGQQAKTMATLELITKKTADAHGTFAKESDSAAGAAQITEARMENMRATMGEALLPVMEKFSDILGAMAGWATKNSTAFQILAGAIAGIAAAVLIVNGALKVYQATMVVIQAVQKATWLANPIGLIVLAIIAVVAAIVLLWKKSETFRRIVLAVWDAIKKGAKAAADFLKRAFKAALDWVVNTFKAAKNKVQAVWDALKGAIKAVANFLGEIWQREVDGWKAIIGRIVDIAQGVWDALKAAIEAVAGFFLTIWEREVNGWKRIIGVVSDIAGKVFGKVREAIGKVVEAVRTLKDKVIGVLKGASTWLVGIGREIINGLIQGINDAMGWLKEKIDQLAAMLPGWLKKKWGIASPSTVMAAIGADLMAGLVEGLASGQTDVEAQLASTSDAIASALADAQAASMLKGKERKAAKREAKRAAAVTAATAKIVASTKKESDALKANEAAREANAAALEVAQRNAEEAATAFDSYASSVRDSARAYGAFTNALGQNEAGEDLPVTAGNMLAAMQARVAAVEEFHGLLAQLQALGASASIIDTLAQAGVEGGLEQARALAKGGPEVVAQFNALQAQLDAAAAALGASTAETMYGEGVRSTQAIVTGLLSQQAALEAAAVTLAQQLADAIEAALEDALADIKIGGGGKKKKGGGKGRSVTSAYLAPVVPISSARSAGTMVAGGGVNVTVTGAIDPEATARQIQRILTGHNRRVGVWS